MEQSGSEGRISRTQRKGGHPVTSSKRGRLHGLPPAFLRDVVFRPTQRTVPCASRRLRRHLPQTGKATRAAARLSAGCGLPSDPENRPPYFPRKPSPSGGLERPENSPVDCFQRKAGGSPGRWIRATARRRMRFPAFRYRQAETAFCRRWGRTPDRGEGVKPLPRGLGPRRPRKPLPSARHREPSPVFSENRPLCFIPSGFPGARKGGWG